MAQRSSKHSEVKTVNFGFDGGLNLHDSPANIADNQMIEARNLFFADKGGLLVTRPGVKLVTRASINDVLLTVNLYPTNGTWRVVGTSVWLASGATIAVTAGRVYLEFTDVVDFTKPTGYYVDVTDNAEITVAYSGSVSVSAIDSTSCAGTFSLQPYDWYSNYYFSTSEMRCDWYYAGGVGEVKDNVFMTLRLPLPKNAVILSADLTAWAYVENSPNIQIKAVASDDSPPPTNSAEARALTLGSESKIWGLDILPATVSPMALRPASPNFKEVLQAIVDRSGWAPGNRATLVFECMTYLSKISFSMFSSEHPPVLNVTWQGVHA
jgi:hypothetical protein